MYARSARWRPHTLSENKRFYFHSLNYRWKLTLISFIVAKFNCNGKKSRTAISFIICCCVNSGRCRSKNAKKKNQRFQRKQKRVCGLLCLRCFLLKFSSIFIVIYDFFSSRKKWEILSKLTVNFICQLLLWLPQRCQEWNRQTGKFHFVLQLLAVLARCKSASLVAYFLFAVSFPFWRS